MDALFRVVCAAGALVAALTWLASLAASTVLFTDGWTVRWLIPSQTAAWVLVPTWCLTILVLNSKSRNAPRQQCWALATRSCPPWIRFVLKAGGVWAANWLAAYFASITWMPDSALAHRRWPDDFVWCWGLAFASATLATLASAVVEGFNQPRGPKGHVVYSSFCGDCGAATGLPTNTSLLPNRSAPSLDRLYRVACIVFAAPPLAGLAFAVLGACRYVGTSFPPNPHHGSPVGVLLLFPSWTAMIILCGRKGSSVEANRLFSAMTRSTPRPVWMFLALCWCVAVPVSLWPAPGPFGNHWFILAFVLFFSIAAAALTSGAAEGLTQPRCSQGHPVNKPFCAACGLPAGGAFS